MKLIYIKEILANLDDLQNTSIKTWGRITRLHKKSSCYFLDITWEALSIQIYIPKNMLIDELHLGDLIECTGNLGISQIKTTTIFADNYLILSHWTHSVSYKNVQDGCRNKLLDSMKKDGFKRFQLPMLIRKYIRDFFSEINFLEVQTPTLVTKYNGGRSLPILAISGSNHQGFLRATFEENMQFLVAAGFCNIFQIGSVFRSSREYSLVEGYSAFSSLDYGVELLTEMLSRVCSNICTQYQPIQADMVNLLIEKRWKSISLIEELSLLVNSSLIKDGNIQRISQSLYDHRIIGNPNVSSETMVKLFINFLADREYQPILVYDIPFWFSPLYKQVNNSRTPHLQEIIGFIPGIGGGFDLGIQENNLKSFEENIILQRQLWNLSDDDIRNSESLLSEIISLGLPPVLGFGMSIDRLTRLWRSDATIDPFGKYQRY